ncbi:ribosome small subunit-dependent GTPase A [Paenibacillus validus]|uniref:Small ribosomal subunit biogenesis GTPase RsgA n=1 Tax=Paenibacillus validus TaxID=44253 RepID=A0A7X2ZEY9_9BACL|nr:MULTISPECIES: ribosome small subunit-dependent GTPase A [Paenibacillus]MED4602575.1 ribosome small subunit-dependent GTPase A [Paenibacillus validus]MED4609644.1 ribosome small subunit-dependent GTPase A [Paenibacillus validus]MUG73695.1 ribosome small subunit-dependent GTPase A [Paenibacillus validus]
MPNGLIVKALSGYYYVLAEGSHDSEYIQCRARGVFKKRNISPLVGDRVAYELTENGEGTVTEILPRSSELVRPPIANVEQVVLVFSVGEPALNIPLLDKFLVHTESAGLDTIICLTKRDLWSPSASDKTDEDSSEELEAVVRLYESIGYPVFVTSSKEGVGVEEVRKRLSGRISVFAGQSGVGKSTLLNAMIPGLQLETNEISMKLGRGKHTTRHVELLRLPNGGIVADTPGFSQLDFLQVDAEGLGACFREFAPFAAQCRFRGCLHLHEPDCKVQEAMEQGRIAASRYSDYVLFLEEIRGQKRRY